ncbi:hypothetical protein ENHYDAX1_220293 [Enhydrobacter sp. AX1]|nr:hypothetical protein ENHYDAX1_220293 [Enhydrobacter sp. AX1]
MITTVAAYFLNHLCDGEHHR